MKKSGILNLRPFRTICSGHRCYTFHFPKWEKEKEWEKQTKKCHGITNQWELLCSVLLNLQLFHGNIHTTFVLAKPEISPRGHTYSLSHLWRDQHLPFQMSLRKIGLFSQNGGSRWELLILWKGIMLMKWQRELCSCKYRKVHQNW